MSEYTDSDRIKWIAEHLLSIRRDRSAVMMEWTLDLSNICTSKCVNMNDPDGYEKALRIVVDKAISAHIAYLKS